LKFLLDENISSLFIEKIKRYYPESVDIFDIGYNGKDDGDIYNFLKYNEYILITFDLDFTDIRKFPPEFLKGIIVLRFKKQKNPGCNYHNIKLFRRIKKTGLQALISYFSRFRN